MSKQKRSRSDQSTDEVLYCERCGISFLWTREEQRNRTSETEAPTNTGGAKGPPAHCPGCRALLPAAERERGTVKWYNARKRFGFIIRQRDGELFVHGSALTGNRKLRDGDLVEFAVTETERGLAAQDVTILQSARQTEE